MIDRTQNKPVLEHLFPLRCSFIHSEACWTKFRDGAYNMLFSIKVVKFW